jgi:type II secretory pathway pseudopilin PulG
MKTPPILLKLLHDSATKPSPNFNKTASRKGDGGFTILELIVIMLIIGILSAIAAPSWQAFITRQRVRTVNDRVFQSLRLAQSEAKLTKRDITITFSAASVDPPTVTFDPPLRTGGKTQTLNAGGEIKSGTIALSTNNAIDLGDADLPVNSIIFDYQGNVKKLPPSKNSATPNARQFVVTVAPANPPNSTPNSAGRQCAIVETLIGGMRTAEGNDCQTTLP